MLQALEAVTPFGPLASPTFLVKSLRGDDVTLPVSPTDMVEDLLIKYQDKTGYSYFK